MALWASGGPASAAPPGGIDGYAPLQRKPAPARASDVLVLGAVAGAMGLGLAHGRKAGEWGSLMAGAGTLAVTAGLTEVTKNLAGRRRPYTWDPGHSAAGLTGYCAGTPPNSPDDCKSFYSGHTAIAAASSFFAVRDLQLRGELKTAAAFRLAYGTAAVLTITTGTLRVLAGQHYISDVAVGAVVGTGLGLLGPMVVF